MNARMRRLAADYEQIKKDFNGNKNIIIEPIGNEPPEKYNITFFLNGIYLLPDGRIETQSRHEVEISLHSDYPRQKPICKINTPIWHPNFRDGQICIGDIWGAGESLSDIIINIGDMIQYKSWNSYSPLSADAAQWAIEHKHIFPVGTINLYAVDYTASQKDVEINIQDEEVKPIVEGDNDFLDTEEGKENLDDLEKKVDETESNAIKTNDFEIFAEDLEGVEFTPVEERMQTASHGGTVRGNKISFKTILVKGLLWACIGAILGFGVSELTSDVLSSKNIAKALGYTYLAKYYDLTEQSVEAFEELQADFKDYAKQNNLDYEDDEAMGDWIVNELDEYDIRVERYLDGYEAASEALTSSESVDFRGNGVAQVDAVANITRLGTAFWSAIIALFIGLFLGIGEGVFYGSKRKAIKYALVGAGISIVIGGISGYFAQWMYSELLSDYTSDFVDSLVRGIGWALMGLGIGVSAGLIRVELKRIIFCALGGLLGGFIGGFLFNFIVGIVPNDIIARGIGIVLMGTLIGVGVGLLEQFAKQAWLKVIRGEFEGKEYLVFAGTTSIGNNGKNTIVLFKDKLVEPHHCDIILEGSKYVLVDAGTSIGTVVNGNRITRHMLQQGDAIAIGKSVLVFNVKKK